MGLNSKNKTLTILAVKDELGKALDKNLLKLNALDTQGEKTTKNLSKGFGKIARIGGIAVLAVGTAVAAGLVKATARAKAFKNEFLELENLNLDKTEKQIQGLQKSVLDTAFKIGKAPVDVSKAFFDVQSGTGLFGKQVADIVSQTGLFSRAVKADFNTTLDSAVKAIRNFGIETDNLDKFFASSFKTVQTGIVTFEQLARVQTDFAGSANTAGQSIDSANKLFSIFTTKTKSAEEAATLTKSAFRDLLKPRTLKGFEKIGISVFDKVTGKVKQLDQIVKELNDKFKPFRSNDAKLTSLVNQFKGSEGLAALIGEVARNGDKMLNTFEQFDKTDFNLSKALRNANADLTTMTNIVKNRLDVVMTKIGFLIVPKIVEGLEFINERVIPVLDEKLPRILFKIEKIFSRITRGFGVMQNQIKGFGDNDEGARQFRLQKLQSEFGIDRSKFKDSSGPLVGFLFRQSKLLKENTQIFGKEEALDRFKKNADKFGLNKFPEASFILDNLQKEQGTNIADKLSSLSKRTAAIGKKTAATPASIAGFPAATGGGQNLQKETSTVGAGNPVRNINVTIQKLIGIETLSTTTVNEAGSNLEEQIKQLLIKAIRDSEIAISQAF